MIYFYFQNEIWKTIFILSNTEWSEFYLDYTSLKTVLKLIDNRKSKRRGKNKLRKKLLKIANEEMELSFNSSENVSFIKNNKNGKTKKKEMLKKIKDISELKDSQKLNYYIEYYKSKLEIFDNFIKNKINENKTQLENLENKIYLNKLYEQNEKNENRERDELGYAVSWKRALSNIYNITSWLHSYYSINILAIKKIEKKAKKLFLLNNIIEIENCLFEVNNNLNLNHNLSELISLRKKIKSIYSIPFF